MVFSYSIALSHDLSLFSEKTAKIQKILLWLLVGEIKEISNKYSCLCLVKILGEICLNSHILAETFPFGL